MNLLDNRNSDHKFSNFTKSSKPDFAKMRFIMSAQGVRDDMKKFVNIYTCLSNP